MWIAMPTNCGTHGGKIGIVLWSRSVGAELSDAIYHEPRPTDNKKNLWRLFFSAPFLPPILAPSCCYSQFIFVYFLETDEPTCPASNFSSTTSHGVWSDAQIFSPLFRHRFRPQWRALDLF